MPNRWIWPFELEEQIGEGGMGVVYRGRYVKNNKYFAVKLLPTDINDKTILLRFEREMDILKRLRHPNIVRSFGGICEDKQRFYAMELVEGGTLKSLIQERGPLPWEQVIEYGLQMCAALSYAHQKGIIHRDVKPGNFLLSQDGRLKLSDFGLISLVAASSITAEGKTLGTFRYMSPEQIRGRPEPSPQTDLYGLGCVLFELLTGRTPFSGKTPAETLHKHLKENPPRVSAAAPECPAALDDLIASLLEKEMDKRPATAAEVASKLTDVTQSLVVETGRREVIQQHKPKPKPKKKASSTNWKPQGSAGWTLILSLLGLVVLLIWNVSLSRRNEELAQAEELWINAYHHSDPAIRTEAAFALAKISEHSEPALKTLKVGLSQDADPHVRAETAAALGEAGAHARNAVSELVKVQKSDENADVRLQAREAIKQIKAAKAPSSSGWGSYFLVILAAVAVGVLGKKFLTTSTV